MHTKILYLTTVLPRKRRTGGEIASDTFIKAIEALGFEVTTVGYTRQSDNYSLNNHEIGVDERPIETASSKRASAMWMLKSLFSGLPYSAAKYHSRTYINKVLQLVAQESFDLVIIEHSQLGWIAEHIPENIPIVFNTQNVENEIYLEEANQCRNPLMAWIYRRESKLIKAMEDNLARKCKQVWTLTSKDRDYFTKLVHSHAVKEFPIPASLARDSQSYLSKQYDIGILGTWTWKSNANGLQWFFDTVYPLLPKSISICIAGNGADWISRANYENVKYYGFVPDALTFLDNAKVIAIPSIAGGGIQIKTLDAIASGSMIVATPFALRGIESPPESVEIASSHTDFSECLAHKISCNNSVELQHQALQWSENRRKNFHRHLNEMLTEILVGKESLS
jgi:hypothetical protein